MTLIISVIAIALALFFAALAWRLARDERARSTARVAALGEAIDEVTSTGPVEHVDVQPAFLSHDRRVSSSGGLIKLAVAGVGAVALIVAVATMSTSQIRSSASSTSATTAAKDGSLELLSMRHTREGDTITVTGLVRNGGAAPAERLIAVVLTFDRGGHFVASGRAPLEFLALAPGDESPFRVSVPNVGDVGRYRVSFRTEAGVVRHVDRRQALLARGQ